MAIVKSPIIGLGVMIFKKSGEQTFVLLGKRKSEPSSGTYAFPGGKLEYLEQTEECILREVREECGPNFLIKKISFQSLFNWIECAPRHFWHVGYTAEWYGGIAELREPDKCEGWKWYDIGNLPHPLFKPSWKMVESYRTGQIYFGDV